MRWDLQLSIGVSIVLLAGLGQPASVWADKLKKTARSRDSGSDSGDDSGSSGSSGGSSIAGELFAELFADVLAELLWLPIEGLIYAGQEENHLLIDRFLKYPYYDGHDGFYVTLINPVKWAQWAQTSGAEQSRSASACPRENETNETGKVKDIFVEECVEPAPVAVQQPQLPPELATQKGLRLLSPRGVTQEEYRSYAVVLGGGYLYDWPDVHVTDLRLFVDTSSVYGFRLNSSLFLEPVESGVDRLYFGEYLANIRLSCQQNAFHFGAGLLTMIHRDEGSHLGGAVFFNFQSFVKRPVLVQSEVVLGGINEALYLRLRAKLGVMISRVELYAGVELRNFFWGETEENIAYFGPVAGTQLWF